MISKFALITLVAFAPSKKSPEVQLSKAEQSMVKEINDWRSERDLPPLVVDPTLMKVARKSAPYFSHRIHGKWVWDRVRDAGFKGFATDNIAKGHETPEDAVQDWGDEVHTVGHDKQMRGLFKMNGRWQNYRFDRVGVGIYKNRYIAIFGKKNLYPERGENQTTR